VAVRKETIKKQFMEAVPAVLEPAERIVAGTFCVSGPSPWLMGVIGVLVMLLLGQRYYFIFLTDRRVIFMKASLMTSRPKGLAWADPVGQQAISDANLDAKLWGHAMYNRPGVKALRLNFHAFWKQEARALVALLPVAGTAQAVPQQMPEQVAPPPPPPPPDNPRSPPL
jgi:hypothetical protein